MTVDRGLLALLEAKPGKGEELAAFLEQGRALAAEETGTVTWYAFRISETTYGIFDTFGTRRAGRRTSTARSRPRSPRSARTCSRPTPTSGRPTSSR